MIFYLIELLVVVAIIAILVIVAIPALMNYTQNARESRVLGDLAKQKTVVEAYAATDGKGIILAMMRLKASWIRQTY